MSSASRQIPISDSPTHGRAPPKPASESADRPRQGSGGDQASYLPTPTSLPRHLEAGRSPPRSESAADRVTWGGIPHLADVASSTLEGTDVRRDRVEETSAGASDADDSGGEPRPDALDDRPFFGDVDMDVDVVEGGEDTVQAVQTVRRDLATDDSPFSSEHRPDRPRRARYASSDSSSASPTRIAAPIVIFDPLTNEPFELAGPVAPLQVEAVEPVLSRPAATTSTSTATSTSDSLRFRSRARNAQTRGTRFSLGCLPLGHGPDESDTTADPTTLDRERSAPSRLLAPLSEVPPWWRTSPAVSTPEDSRPVHLVPGHASLTSSPSLAQAATLGRADLAQPRASSFDSFSSFSLAERLHSQASTSLQQQGNDILREAEATLRAREAILRDAEETTRRARTLLIEDRADRERERRLAEIPSVEAFPTPAETVPRPVVGMRIGEGWPSTSSATPQSPPGSATTRTRRTSSLFSRSPPSSPDQDGLESAGTSSRTRQFLTELRARRPRFSRNSTSIAPPELDPVPAAGSPNLALGLSGTTFDEQAERQVATELNERLLERRRVSASLEPVSPQPASSERSLWGEVFARTRRSRMRGPTELENERWRRGESPSLASASTAPALDAAASHGTFSQEARAPETPFRLGAQAHGGSIRIDNGVTEASVREYFSRRDESPSPERRANARSSGASAQAIPPMMGAPSSNDQEQNSMNPSRPSVRFAAPDLSSRPASLTRLRFDDDDEDTTAHTHNDGADASTTTGWRSPHLPLMLPSGSSGRRMVFPHPASAAGQADPLDAAEEGRAPPGFGGSLSASNEASESQVDDGSSRRTVGFYASRYSRPTRLMPWDDPSPLGDLPPPTTTTSTAAAAPSLVPATSPSTELDAGGHASGDAADWRTQFRQSRLERLAALRGERALMRGLLGDAGSVGLTMGTDRASSSSPERSALRDRLDREQQHERERERDAPTGGVLRRRGLGDFFRGLGHGARLISIFDEDFGAFWGRDAVALDSRNYLDDDEWDSSYEALLRLSAAIGDAKPKGVSPEKISALRTFAYSDWPYIEHQRSTTSADNGGSVDPIASTSAVQIVEDKPALARKGIEKEAICPVCLCDYDDDDEITLAHCSHGFHSACLKAWLKDHGSCPVCRRDHTA
ncbi:hypothetical protein JCM10212_005165 [Sporobolomyces blumeae]